MSGPPGKPAPSVLGLPPVSFSKLYTFATPRDKLAVALGCVSAAASGAILPLFSLVFGAALNILNDDKSQIAASVSRLALYFLLIAIGASALTFAEVSLVGLATERMMRRLRAAYCANLLRLDFAWYDTHRAPEAVSRLAEATVTMSTGLDKVATALRYIATLICGIAIGFSTSWKLTLVIMACAPLFAVALATLIIIAVSSEKAERTAYARAGDAANEAFSLVRAVAAYGGEVAETLRYSAFAQHARNAGIRKGVGIGTAVGFMLSVFYSMYAISTYVGALFIIESRAANSQCIFAPATAGCFSGGTVVQCASSPRIPRPTLHARGKLTNLFTTPTNAGFVAVLLGVRASCSSHLPAQPATVPKTLLPRNLTPHPNHHHHRRRYHSGKSAPSWARSAPRARPRPTSLASSMPCRASTSPPTGPRSTAARARARSRSSSRMFPSHTPRGPTRPSSATFRSPSPLAQ